MYVRRKCALVILDHETNSVYISNRLEREYPAVVQALQKLLGDPLHTIPKTNDIWCRDYMPIQLAESRFVQFRYRPDYLMGYPHLRTEDAARLLDLTHTCPSSRIVIDGGNVVHWSTSAIMTEKVFRENHRIEPARLEQQVRDELEIERLIFLPQEPGDKIGHTDGMVRFVNEETLLVNDYTDESPAYGKELNAALKGFESIPFPYAPTDEPGTDPDIEPAVGVYINFLQVGNVIVCPTFNQTEDDDALRTLEDAFPESRVVPLKCRQRALGGGVLNCVMWNIRG